METYKVKLEEHIEFPSRIDSTVRANDVISKIIHRFTGVLGNNTYGRLVEAYDELVKHHPEKDFRKYLLTLRGCGKVTTEFIVTHLEEKGLSSRLGIN